MEELLKLVELVRQEAPHTRVKVDSLMVTNYFTMEELLNICNKYADYKCGLSNVVEQSEQLCANLDKNLNCKMISKKLESEEFYNLMQEYRHAPVSDQKKVLDKFNAVKKWIKTNCKTKI